MPTKEASKSADRQQTLDKLHDITQFLDTTAERLSSSTGNDKLFASLDNITETADAISSVDMCIRNISDYFSQMQALVENALESEDAAGRRALGEEFNSLLKQIENETEEYAKACAAAIEKAAPDIETQPEILVTPASLAQNAAFMKNDIGVEGEAGAVNAFESDISTDPGEIHFAAWSKFALTFNNDVYPFDVKGAENAVDSLEIDWGGDDYVNILNDLSTKVGAMRGAFEAESSSILKELSIITSREEFSSDKIAILDDTVAESTEIEDLPAHKTSVDASRELETQQIAMTSPETEGELKNIES